MASSQQFVWRGHHLQLTLEVDEEEGDTVGHASFFHFKKCYPGRRNIRKHPVDFKKMSSLVDASKISPLVLF